MDASMLELNQKIDALTAQVAFLAEQAQIAQREREERVELMETVMPIAKDALRLATNELVEVQEYLELEDLIRLLKKAIRHGPQFEMLLDQIDTVTDLIDVLGPIPREGVDKITAIFAELERKGYFAFGRSGMRMAENVVSAFTEEDVDRLGDNLVLILNTVKDMTQPEIMNFIRTTVANAEREIEKPVNTSLGAIIGQMNDPAVRRGLALTLRVLKVVGEQAAPK